MSYRVLALKWRPQSFDAVAGQPHVVRSLVNALTRQRLHHAYLFTGTRGVGKTTIARLLARCLNCANGISATPCLTCEACQAISDGRFLDLIEVDAASRTKVEDTRELLDNVQYAPNQGRYKVYLIDEVHMLSGHSFNALLKTLEEPPPHVIFLLATTDPQKLPVTVLSRCLQFHLKRLAIPVIVQQLAHILDAEKIDYEPEALPPLAYAAQGSMRDALSLLDQAIAYSDHSLTYETVRALLGHTHLHDVLSLLDALLTQDAHAVMKHTSTLDEQGADFERVFSDLQTAIHQLTLCQAVPQLAQQNPWGETDAIRSRIGQADLPRLKQLYADLLKGSTYLTSSPGQRSGFEMLMLALIGEPADLPPTSDNTTDHDASTHQADVDWTTVVKSLDISGLTQVIASHCVLDRLTESTIYLCLNPMYQALFTDKQKKQLNDALTQHFKQARQLEVRIEKASQPTPSEQAHHEQAAQTAQAKQALMADPNVAGLIHKMDGSLVDDSIV